MELGQYDQVYSLCNYLFICFAWFMFFFYGGLAFKGLTIIEAAEKYNNRRNDVQVESSEESKLRAAISLYEWSLTRATSRTCSLFSGRKTYWRHWFRLSESCCTHQHSLTNFITPCTLLTVYFLDLRINWWSAPSGVSKSDLSIQKSGMLLAYFYSLLGLRFQLSDRFSILLKYLPDYLQSIL